MQNRCKLVDRSRAERRDTESAKFLHITIDQYLWSRNLIAIHANICTLMDLGPFLPCLALVALPCIGLHGFASVSHWCFIGLHLLQSACIGCIEISTGIAPQYRFMVLVPHWFRDGSHRFAMDCVRLHWPCNGFGLVRIGLHWIHI